LLIITNDGNYADKLTHPRYEVCKTYHVLVNEPIAETELRRLRAGIIDDGEKLKPESIECIGKCQYRLILNEGKKREIRRLLGAVGKDTLQLQRVAIGKLLLGNLPVGSWRHLTQNEVDLSMISDIKP
jgi:23S rRNA pseudouridine2605 synthase